MPVQKRTNDYPIGFLHRADYDVKRNCNQMRKFRNILIVVSICFGSIGYAQTSFPNLKIDDLNGRTVFFPDELPGDPTIVFITYKQRHQEDVSEWARQLNLKEDSGLEWIELPVIGRGGRLMRTVIDNGMDCAQICLQSGLAISAIRGW